MSKLQGLRLWEVSDLERGGCMLRTFKLMTSATRAMGFGGLSLLSLLLLCSPLSAQQGLSTLRGTVTDKSAAIVVGVSVSARQVSTNITERTVTTDAQGNYEMPGLKAGTYQVTASISGFKTSVVDDVQLQSSQ